MNTYEFSLLYSVPPSEDIDDCCALLYDENLEDICLIGMDEEKNRLELNFEIQGNDAETVMRDLKSLVERTLPNANFIAAYPDYVGHTDIARYLNVSRQAVMKQANKIEDFPAPIHEGRAALWNLADVLPYFNIKDKSVELETLKEIAAVTMAFNIEEKIDRLDKIVSDGGSSNGMRVQVSLVKTVLPQKQSEIVQTTDRVTHVASPKKATEPNYSYSVDLAEQEAMPC